MILQTNEEFDKINQKITELSQRIRADYVTIYQGWWPRDANECHERQGLYSVVLRTEKNHDCYIEELLDIQNLLKRLENDIANP